MRVVCLGDSLTRALVSASFIDLLRRCFDGENIEWINAGINGDHSYNLLRRLNRVAARKPDVVIVLVGTNDVNADVNPLMYWFSRIMKGVPQRPTVDRYRSNMQQIVRRLKEVPVGRIALASPPLIGEDLDSLSNRRARQYSAALKEIAAGEGIAYLPVHEIQEEELKARGNSHGGEYRRSLLRSIELVLCHLILRESYDSISRRRNYHLVTDGIHMNSLGAELIASQYEIFLREVLQERRAASR